MKVKNILNRKTIIVMGIIILGLITVLIYQSYALFKTNKKMNFINSKVGTFNPSKNDFKLAILVDEVNQDTFPVKNSGYYYHKTECSNSGMPNWDYTNWKLAITDLTDKTECSIHFYSTDCDTQSNQNALHCRILTNAEGNYLKEGNPTFNAVSSDTDTGLWKFPETGGESHYFRGTKNLLNNNVIFAGHQWKAIRIDKDGNTKLIYNGTCPNNSCIINDIGTNTQIDSKTYSSTSPNASTVLYNHNSVTIRSIVDNWYENNLLSYDTYIADVSYCNDRNSYSSSSGEYGYTNNYAPKQRVGTSSPTLECPSNSKYSTIAENGNGLLKYKVALITSDEVLLGGIGHDNVYLYAGQLYWTISPSRTQPHSTGWNVEVYAMLDKPVVYSTTYSAGVRPVIALIAPTKIISGDGSLENPYIIATPDITP